MSLFLPNLSCTNCANPVASPASTTTYTVEIIDPDLCGPIIREVTVTADCDCTCDLSPDFISTQEASCSTYTFTNNSSGNACTNIVGANWDFGDGVTGTGNSTTHTFPGPGSYNVCMTVAGFDGEICCDDTICYTVIVECDTNDCECPLSPDFSYNVDRCQVEFFDRTITDCEIISTNWDFGDGTYASVPNPVHVYNAAGTYTVCLTVKTIDPDSGECCTDSVCFDVDVEDCEPCECEIILNHLTADIMGCDVNFSADVAADCKIVDVYWDFGDGNTVSGNYNPTHNYGYNGTYNYCVTITYLVNGENCTKTFCDMVIIEDCEPDPCADRNGDAKDKTSGVNPDEDPSSSMALSVFPNPSSGLVSISFQTVSSGQVEIDVHDVTGKHITSLADKKMEAGSHTISWDPSDSGMSFGLYHIIVKYGEKGETVKFMYER